jgi:tRNA-dependent cyclodipeptide synthase
MTTHASVACTGYTSADQAQIDAGKTILLGISPFNSFYTTQCLTTLVTWATREFSDVHVLLAGHEAAYRLVAAGVAPARAVRRVTHHIHDMRKVCRRALTKAGYSQPNRHIHVWTTFHANPRYRQLYEAALLAYEQDEQVRSIAQTMITQALNSTLDRAPTPADIEANIPYVAAEIPLLVDTPGVLESDSAVVTYHQRIPFADWARSTPDGHPLSVSDRQAFALVSLDEVDKADALTRQQPVGSTR